MGESMRVFVLEDDAQRIALFWRAAIGHDMTLAKDVDEACKKFDPPYDLICLDHDLGGEVYVSSEQRNTGAGFCRWLAERGIAPCGRVVIHSYNADGARAMGAIMRDAGWLTIWVPFGPTVLGLFGQSNGEARSADAVDPHAASTGKPSTRVEGL